MNVTSGSIRATPLSLPAAVAALAAVLVLLFSGGNPQARAAAQATPNTAEVVAFRQAMDKLWQDCQWPTGLPVWRPGDLPIYGHLISRLADSSSPSVRSWQFKSQIKEVVAEPVVSVVNPKGCPSLW